MTLLHVTNGDGARHQLRAAGITGDLVTWDDVLHEGPVPGGVPPERLRETRARFLAGCGRTPFEPVLAHLSARDDALAAAAEAEEVVLWFEHDLYDQLQLCQVLDRLCCSWPQPARMTLVCEAEYLGTMAQERVRELFAGRRPLTPAQTSTGRALWGGFTAPDPAILESALATDTSALRFAAAAFRRHLQEYPWTGDGLSRTERQVLRALAGAAAPGRVAYPASHHAVEDPIFLGDSTWAWIVERLSRVPHPLVTFADGTSVEVPVDEDAQREFWDRPLALTDAGRDVLRGRADHLRLNGIDRWLGGVHLTVATCWRWNEAAGRTERVPPA